MIFWKIKLCKLTVNIWSKNVLTNYDLHVTSKRLTKGCMCLYSVIFWNSRIFVYM